YLSFSFTLIYSSEFVVLILVLELNKEFKDKRKKHYNEYSKVKLARKLIEQELKDLEDADDSVANNTKEGPSSSQDAADTQMDET
ncbi:protein phosphatase inhibitor 2-like, partial [Orbicella faveolata]|uniref:protein phosphatase inhibitor 2-like n=1 Tax=Orbicella faveolata TaxID=48498 RepID=UPI0009E27A98